MIRRAARLGLIPIMALILGAACTQQAPSAAPTAAPPGAAPKAAATSGDVRVPETIGSTATPSGAPKAAASPSPGAATKTTAAASPAAKVEPKGQVVYAFDTAISTAWYDPQENTASLSAYAFQYALHDALVRPMPGNVFSPNLAESYEIAPDFKSATFKLRPNIKFHDGSPITPEDVKFTYESYRGTKAQLFKSKTDRIETPDARTVRFVFKEPFLDFLINYGTPASGAGWIIPKAYYQQVGPDGFKQKPIGAGPFKFVRQTAGQDIELEAFTDYWRKTPSVKTVIIKGVPEASTRVAMLQTGEADFVNVIPGQLIPTIRSDPKLQLAPVRSTNFWLEFPDIDKPENPLSKAPVRKAVALALDRDGINDAEQAGLGEVTSTWIPENWPDAIKGPPAEYNPARAKQLLAEAGYPNGFEVEEFTPWPPYISMAERMVTQLREVGIRAKTFNQMERAALLSKLGAGPGAMKGIVMVGAATPGDAAVRIRDWAACGGSMSFTCLPEIQTRLDAYDKSTDPGERTRLIQEIQKYMLDNDIVVSIFRNAFIVGVGPRIANKWEEVIGATPQYVYVAPYEDIRLKDGQ